MHFGAVHEAMLCGQKLTVSQLPQRYKRRLMNQRWVCSSCMTYDPHLQTMMLKHYTALREIIAPIQWKIKRFLVLAMIIFIELVKWISLQQLLFSV